MAKTKVNHKLGTLLERAIIASGVDTKELELLLASNGERVIKELAEVLRMRMDGMKKLGELITAPQPPIQDELFLSGR